MEEAVGFFRALETWIYAFLGLWGLITIRKFVLAWQELRGAVFGLERESAQTRLNRSAAILVFILTMTVAEFTLVSFVAPALPGPVALSTPTLDLLAAPTTTLQPGAPATDEPQTPQETPLAEQLSSLSVNCIPDQIQIDIPRNGEEIRGVIPIVGSANIPNFGFYKFEIKKPDETVWLTIQAGNAAVINGKLGDWDTSRLTPGEYQLALVVVDNQAKSSDPCIVQVRILPPPDVIESP